MSHHTLLQQFNPHADALIIAFSTQIDDEMLMRIACNDWGEGVDEHLAELRRIRDEYAVLAPMGWHPKEVLELERWSEPTTEQGHLSRAFACAALLRVQRLPENDRFFDGDNQTIVILLESLAVLDLSFQRAALRFFAWRVQDLRRNDEEIPFYLLALLLLTLRLKIQLSHKDLKELITWIHAEVRDIRHDHIMTDLRFHGMAHWLTWMTIFNMRHDLWQILGQEIAARSKQYENATGGQNLRALAKHLQMI